MISLGKDGYFQQRKRYKQMVEDHKRWNMPEGMRMREPPKPRKTWLEVFANRHTQAVRESQYTPQEALELAVLSGAKFRRRFRVEGSAAGTSRLVTKSSAKRLRKRYGGQIVELVPDLWHKSPANVLRANGLPYCPTCRVEPDEACRHPKGAMRPPHEARMQLFDVMGWSEEKRHEQRRIMTPRTMAMVRRLGDCPRCKVGPYQACVQVGGRNNGRARSPHRERPALTP